MPMVSLHEMDGADVTKRVRNRWATRSKTYTVEPRAEIRAWIEEQVKTRGISYNAFLNVLLDRYYAAYKRTTGE